MRVKNSVKNIFFGMFSQIVIVLLGFISRKVFIDSLGSEYLGINGLLTNVLSMLSLVEGGIGTSITYNMYKPLSKNDEKKIIALVQLYKKIYTILAVIILILSCLIYPFMFMVVKGTESVSYIFIVYYMFVFKNIISYLNAHKWSLINADQKEYTLAKYNIIFNTITTISKIFILKLTQSYILFLVVDIIIYSFQNIWNGRIVNKKYPYIKTKEKYYVDKSVKNNLMKNTKAIFLHNIGSYCVFGTDNILISALVNIKTVGFYSNYTLITNQLNTMLGIFMNGISNSIGNLIAKENNKKVYEIFRVTLLINFIMYSIGTIFLYNVMELFIDWCFGEGMLLDKVTLIVILLNFYLTGMRRTVSTFKSKAGIFSEDRYAPLIESIINLGASIILQKYFGLVGIFLGTTISSICVPIWIQAKLLYDKLFNRSVMHYFKIYIVYLIINIPICIITPYICRFITFDNTFINLIYRGIASIIIPIIYYFVIFIKTKELKYILDLVKSGINKFIDNYKFKLTV